MNESSPHWLSADQPAERYCWWQILYLTPRLIYSRFQERWLECWEKLFSSQWASNLREKAKGRSRERDKIRKNLSAKFPHMYCPLWIKRLWFQLRTEEWQQLWLLSRQWQQWETPPGALPGHCRGVDVPGLTQQGGFVPQPEKYRPNHQSWNEISSHCKAREVKHGPGE